MLYNYLSQYVNQPNLNNLIHYISFRSGVAFFLSLIISILIGDKFIFMLKKWQKYGQPIRVDGPESHFSKAGTPTMGGILIILTSLISILITSDIKNSYVVVIILALVSFGILGFIDDYLKVRKRNHKGVFAKVKLIFQILLSVIIGFWIRFIFEKSGVESGALTLPFFKNFVLNLGYFYIPFICCVITGSSNAVNLTDGLDGLAIFPIMLSLVFFGIVAYLSGHQFHSKYLYMIHIPHVSEIAVVLSAIIGSGLGFLWFNFKPAQVFMGDVGSLSLGAVIGVVSVITKHELTLFISGGLFVIEALSVMIQVLYFKTTGGKRIFRMAPIHHHYEKLGLPETKIVVRFWIVAVMFTTIGLLSIKIR